MKRFLLIILTLSMLLSLVACNKGEDIRGNSIGDRCYGMELSVIDENGETGEKINPGELGRVTIINFWGVWCPYCLYEMPDLDRIASEFENEVTVVAIHTFSRKSEAPGFIASGYKDSDIIFAQDTDNDDYYGKMTNTGYYPYTVILDKEGKIIDIKIGATDYAGFYNAIKDLIK